MKRARVEAVTEAAKRLGVELTPWQAEFAARVLAEEQVIWYGGRRAGWKTTRRVVTSVLGSESRVSGALRRSDRFLSNPCADRNLCGGYLDQGEFVVSESEVDGVGSRVAGGGPTSGALVVVHSHNIIVKQKTLALEYLMLYDKYMETTNPIHEPLTDIATRFVILPGALADALDEHGPDKMAWAWVDGSRLLRLEVEA